MAWKAGNAKDILMNTDANVYENADIYSELTSNSKKASSCASGNDTCCYFKTLRLRTFYCFLKYSLLLHSSTHAQHIPVFPNNTLSNFFYEFLSCLPLFKDLLFWEKRVQYNFNFYVITSRKIIGTYVDDKNEVHVNIPFFKISCRMAMST